MQLFKLDDRYTVVCDTKDTRSGFKHEATLFSNGNSIGKVKICYLNRTWESFCYESVLIKLINTYLESEVKKYLKVIYG